VALTAGLVLLLLRPGRRGAMPVRREEAPHVA